jgi:Ca2+-binding RTX toxin-like protein
MREMTITPTSRSARPRGPLAGFLLAAACLVWLSYGSAAEAAKRTCGGKRATIVSNAVKIVGTKAHDVIVGGPGANTILGAGGNDTICGGPGEDSINGERGNDAILGEDGDDTIYGERGSDELDGGDGTDYLLGETGNDALEGGPGNGDDVDAGPGDDTTAGGPGHFDTVFGGVGNDSIDGGPGAHDIASFRGVGGPIAVDLGAGTVNGAEQEDLNEIEDAVGGSGNDRLTGADASSNRLDGGPGNDRLNAAGGDDAAFGGPGSDACDGAFAQETSCGPAARGKGAAVELYRSITGSSSLIVTGSRAADAVAVSFTGAGYLVQGAGADVQVRLAEVESESCVRDAGANSVSCRGNASSIMAALGAGDDSFSVADDVPAEVPATIDGGLGSDTLRGGPGPDILYGGDDQDADTLEGASGDDALFGVNIFHPRHDSGGARMIGGAGDDLLVGGQPCDGDLFDGGSGDNDSASFARIRNDGTNVMATIGGPVTDPDLGECNAGSIDVSVEKIEGSPGPDVLIGSEGPNTLLGRGGNDELDGRGGLDRCIEGGGSDSLSNCEFDSWSALQRTR